MLESLRALKCHHRCRLPSVPYLHFFFRFHSSHCRRFVTVLLRATGCSQRRCSLLLLLLSSAAEFDDD
uniref:Uncharacterized protein n=1 Tax=Globodera rostochiensis TaxID=31243 RepID=A0A914I001_GLORO